MLAVMLAVWAMIVETTIINVAIPTIMRHFSMTQDSAQWLSTGFLGGMSATILLAPWMDRSFGQRRVYIAALSLFVVSSMLGGFANSTALLILARTLQGAIAGLIQPLALVSVYRAFPVADRGKAMAVYGLGVVLAPALGPALGGYLVTLFSWRAIFFVSVPVCLISIWLSSVYLPKDESPEPRSPFDWLGFVLLSLSLASLLVGFVVGHREGWLSLNFLVRLAVTLCLAGSFVLIEAKLDHPLINLQLLRNKRFVATTLVAFAYGLGQFGSTYLIPLYVQSVAHYDAGKSGVLLIPAGIALALSITMGGRLPDYFPTSRLMIVGLGLLVISFLLLATTGKDTSFFTMAAFVVIGHFGLGLTVPAMTIGALKVVPSDQFVQAAGAISFFRQVGGAIGVNALSIFLDWMSAREAQFEHTVGTAQAAPFSNSFFALSVIFLLAIYPAWRSGRSNA